MTLAELERSGRGEGSKTVGSRVVAAQAFGRERSAQVSARGGDSLEERSGMSSEARPSTAAGPFQ